MSIEEPRKKADGRFSDRREKTVIAYVGGFGHERQRQPRTTNNDDPRQQQRMTMTRKFPIFHIYKLSSYVTLSRSLFLFLDSIFPLSLYFLFFSRFFHLGQRFCRNHENMPYSSNNRGKRR